MTRDNAPVETLDYLGETFEFSPRLADDCQYSTIFVGDRPKATLQRRRVMERSGPIWSLYATDGSLIRVWWFRPSYAALARAAALALNAK